MIDHPKTRKRKLYCPDKNKQLLYCCDKSILKFKKTYEDPNEEFQHRYRDVLQNSIKQEHYQMPLPTIYI